MTDLEIIIFISLVIFLVSGFLVTCYACCTCPSGHLDEAFWEFPPEDPYRMERQLAKLERENE